MQVKTDNGTFNKLLIYEKDCIFIDSVDMFVFVFIEDKLSGYY
jgi:hypothetical protein